MVAFLSFSSNSEIMSDQTLLYLIFFLIDISLAEIIDKRCFVTVCKLSVVVPMEVAHILPAVIFAELV